MAAAKRGRGIAAIAISALLHAVLLVAVARHAPTLVVPTEPRGPPEPVIPVLLTPKLPPSVQAPGARPGPIRLHRRRLRFMPPELPVAPLPVPEQPAPAPTPRPPVFRPAPLPEGGQREELRATLRHGPIGCANPQAAGLTREEREACDEQFGAGARDAAAVPAGASLSAGSRNALGRAAARKEEQRLKREAPPPPGANDATGASGQPWEVRKDPH